MPGYVRAELDRLSKADDKPEKPKAPRWRITGIASTEHVDRQGDTIRQSGLDWRQFLESGYINDDHGRGAEHVIGYPTAVRKITLRDGKGGKPVAATAIEGFLFDVERAEKLAHLAKSMEGTARQMGFSVEGPPPKRSAIDPKEIVAATITHVALTPWPVNPNALAVVTMSQLAKSFSKAMTAGSGVATPDAAVPGDAAPLIVQDLIGAGRRKRKRIPIKEALAQIMGALAASANKPAGSIAAEGVNSMGPKEFMKAKLSKMSDAEMKKLAKNMGYGGEDDEEMEDDDEMEKSDPGVDPEAINSLLKSLNEHIETAGRTASFDKSASVLGGLAKSGNGEASALKAVLDDVRDVLAENLAAAEKTNAHIDLFTQFNGHVGEIVANLAKSLRSVEAKVEGLSGQIAQATGRPGAPKATVSAKPVPRFPDDAVPGAGGLAKGAGGGGHPLASMPKEKVMAALSKGFRDALDAGETDKATSLNEVVTLLQMGASEFTAAQREAVMSLPIFNVKG